MQTIDERLGSFYLGAEYDLSTGKRLEVPLNYDARDLTTHAVCVGMTGSGKTGLCIGLLEEAALDRVPLIIVDPKGDMTNLLLQFPELLPEDFLPWMNEDDARRKGKSPEELARETSELWKNGLADWGIGAERIRLLHESGEFTIYTPGSETGIPVSILGSLASPDLDFEEHAETIRERISGTVNALLGLAGLQVDPVRSRESILLASIFEHYWKQGQDLDLATLITSIQKPPIRQLGVFDINTFFPEKDRFELAMSLNALLASPSFQSWLKGDPLDIDSMLFTADGKPRNSIFYLAHLSESERMFFVTLLLENVLTWTRAQSGTSSLRALLYFDEVFGYLPPVAEPPSKRPLLTLLKQARAFGVGCVLVTQNPVDLDYKALTNTGTWFIGKLQAERDKERVLEGLKSAISEAGGPGGSVDYDGLISQLGNRIFLMHNVHEERPVVFQTRWAMSFLSGPMTRPQIKKLMDPMKVRQEPSTAAVTARRVTSDENSTTEPALPFGFTAQAPGLAPSVKQLFIPIMNASGPPSAQLVYEPALIGMASVVFADRKRAINETSRIVLACMEPGNAGALSWDKSEQLAISGESMSEKPDPRAVGFGVPPESFIDTRQISSSSQSLANWLYQTSRFHLSVHAGTGLFRHGNESDRDFTIRVQQAAREKRDQEVDALEKKFAPRLERIQEKIRGEQRELTRDEEEHQNRKTSEIVGLGTTMLGFFLGRKSTSSINSALNRRRMTANARADIEESQEVIEELAREQRDLEEELKEAVNEISDKWEHSETALTAEELAPRHTDITVQLIALGWLPYWRLMTPATSGGNSMVPAWQMPE